MSKGWIGVDLDGTLAEYNGFIGIEHIGAPVAPMLERVKRWLAEGRDVKIFTARVTSMGPDDERPEIARRHIAYWLGQVGLPELEITNVKDFAMDELWDDRAVQVIANTGMNSCPSPRGLA